MGKTIFIILIEPEARMAEVHPVAYTTLEAAQKVIRETFSNPEQKSDTIFRDEAYTYFYIERVEVM